MNAKVQTKIFTLQYPLKRKEVRTCPVEGPKYETVVLGEFSVMVKGYYNGDTNPLDIRERYRVDLDGIFYEGKEVSTIVDYFSYRSEIEEAAMRAFAKIIEHQKGKEVGNG